MGYIPEGLNNGTVLYSPSTSTGTLRARLRSSGVVALPFQVLNHGPPPTSTAAMLLVTSNIIYKIDKIKRIESQEGFAQVIESLTNISNYSIM